MIYKLTSLVFLLLAAWLGLRLFDAQLTIEEVELHEGLIHSERDFLMTLPKMIQQSSNNEMLIEQLQQKYPNVSIGPSGGNICWGRLLLKFETPRQLSEVLEGCEKSEVTP